MGSKAKSNLEETFALHLRLHKDIPGPWQRQYRFSPARKWTFDFALPGRHNLAVECEGGLFVFGRHNRPVSMQKDMEKYNAAAMLGWRVGRFTLKMIEEGQAIAWVRGCLNERV